MIGGGSALPQRRTPVFRFCTIKFRANIRIEVAEAAVDREFLQVEFAIPATAVATQMMRTKFRDREREHRPIRQDGARVPAELRIEAFPAQNILYLFITLGLHELTPFRVGM